MSFWCLSRVETWTNISRLLFLLVTFTSVKWPSSMVIVHYLVISKPFSEIWDCNGFFLFITKDGPDTKWDERKSDRRTQWIGHSWNCFCFSDLKILGYKISNWDMANWTEKFLSQSTGFAFVDFQFNWNIYICCHIIILCNFNHLNDQQFTTTNSATYKFPHECQNKTLIT